jgi:hypothetical protein
MWTIPNLDPYVNYTLKEVARWAAENAVTILVVSTLLTWLQSQALRLEQIKDNKKLSLLGFYMVRITKCLLYIFSFQWLRQFITSKTTEKKAENGGQCRERKF